MCLFNFDFYETLNLSSYGPKLSTPGCIPQSIHPSIKNSCAHHADDRFSWVCPNKVKSHILNSTMLKHQAPGRSQQLPSCSFTHNGGLTIPLANLPIYYYITQYYYKRWLVLKKFFLTSLIFSVSCLLYSFLLYSCLL